MVPNAKKWFFIKKLASTSDNSIILQCIRSWFMVRACITDIDNITDCKTKRYKVKTETHKNKLTSTIDH